MLVGKLNLLWHLKNVQTFFNRKSNSSYNKTFKEGERGYLVNGGYPMKRNLPLTSDFLFSLSEDIFLVCF